MTTQDTRQTTQDTTPTHTPGPWQQQHCKVVTGYDADGDHNLVAECGFLGDARLIAAAPELLAMLERVLDGVLRLPELPGTLCPLDIEQARAAIIKATGGLL